MANRMVTCSMLYYFSISNRRSYTYKQLVQANNNFNVGIQSEKKKTILLNMNPANSPKMLVLHDLGQFCWTCFHDVNLATKIVTVESSQVVDTIDHARGRRELRRAIYLLELPPAWRGRPLVAERLPGDILKAEFDNVDGGLRHAGLVPPTAAASTRVVKTTAS